MSDDKWFGKRTATCKQCGGLAMLSHGERRAGVLWKFFRCVHCKHEFITKRTVNPLMKVRP